MGCSSSSDTGGGGKGKADKIDFKHTGMHDLDQFFTQVEKLVDDLDEATEPLEEAQEKMNKEAGFLFEPGASNRFLLNNSQSQNTQF